MSSFSSYSAFLSLHSPIQELNFRQLSLPTNSMSAGMFSSDSRDLRFETKTWGQMSCFISQRCLGRHTHAIHNMPPPQDFGMKHLHLASLQETGIWLVSAPMAHCSFALWKSIQLSSLSPKSLIPHIRDLLFMHIILSTAPITSWDWEMQLCP